MVESVPKKQVARVRREAPGFSADAWWENRMQRVSLEQFRGKYVVLFFWPADFTFVCPTEICQFNDKKAAFDEINTQLVGISVDSKFAHREYTLKPRDKGGLGPMDVPLVADNTKSISASYGCLIEGDDDGEVGVAMRATYIIAPDGTLRHACISDLPVGRNVEETIRLVKGFQYTDEHGEVCPSGWEPGAATMVPDHASDALTSFWANEHGK